MIAPAPHPQIQPGDAGVSLIELLIVLAIVSMAMVVALPSFRGPSKAVELQAVAHDLANNLRMARATAISRSRATGLVFDVNERRYMTEVDNRAVQLPRDLTLTVTSARQFMRGSSETRLVFFPDGSSSGGNIVVERQRQTIEIGVDWLTGQARVGGRR